MYKDNRICNHFSLCNQRENFKTYIFIICWCWLAGDWRNQKPGHSQSFPATSTASDTIYFSFLIYFMFFEMSALEHKI